MKAKRKILIVDDDDLTLRYMRYLLEQCDYLVTSCGSSEEALRLITTARFEAFLTDYNMAGMSGLELVARFRAQFPGGFVVGMSGFEMSDAFSAAGADRFLHKPTLPATIEQVFCNGRI